MKKNNAWNIRHLVNELFVPSTHATQRIILKIVGFATYRLRSSFLAYKWLTKKDASIEKKCLLTQIELQKFAT